MVLQQIENSTSFMLKVGNQTADGVPYRVVNLYAKHRYTYLFVDTPHLLKTLQNCLNVSGFDQQSLRLMWNDGKYFSPGSSSENKWADKKGRSLQGSRSLSS